MEIKWKELRKELPYKWRVQSFSKRKPVATCVPYIDSRDVMELLDDVVSPANWTSEFYSLKNSLFCKIGIWDGTKWVFKSDCGMESNVDAQKGEASDAFKRSAVHFGIGRFLYHMDVVYLDADMVKDKNNYPNIVDARGNKVWDITDYINKTPANQRRKNSAGSGTGKPKPNTTNETPSENDVKKLHLHYMEIFYKYVEVAGVKEAERYHPDRWEQRKAANYQAAIPHLNIKLNKLKQAA